MSKKSEEGFATKAIHAGQDPKQWTYRSVVPPLVMSTTFVHESPGKYRGYYYSRSGNPGRTCLETCLAALENGKHCLVYPSGIGTITALIELLKSGDHVLCSADVYGGTNYLFDKGLTRQNISTSFVDVCDTDNFVKSIQSNTKLIWIESPSNPLLKLGDIRAISDKVKSIRPDIYIVIDNTFATSYFQRPLEHGADIVMYSLTKYMNGHSDVVMGAAVTNRDDINDVLRFSRTATGIVPSPYDCAQVNRGLKTLELRMKQHMKNGLAVAKFLETHPLVIKVIHPLLESHPQYELAKRQMSGHSGMVSFYLKGNVDKFLKSLKLFTLAGSLGDVESLAAFPTIMSHPLVSKELKARIGINDQLIRLSVGLETERDIIADLDQALKCCAE